MMHFSLFNLTFTVSIRKQRTNQERYEDHIRIDALRNQMLDKRYECRRYMY
ncbi:YrzI family small protein [Sporolactobacillus sp. CPB3-1]|uniref:YrzI family small protein n=1 Tax=Sporolactobacillus mangiferae TaxID=2940498 RepID=A0ABT0M6X5_9BACL|nr:YrzI family small protein [Sporolactobacillus mangiferae]MCL1630594.1 YrzI family small protein [Sporolactobacillus mangiferae]